MSQAAFTSATQQQRIVSSAPGRICLFGEHQDYIKLPIIAAAINLRVTLDAVTTPEVVFQVDLPDIGERHEFDPAVEQQYAHGRDYLPAAINVLRRQGVTWKQGFQAVVRGQIPINSGTSSSSALVVAWCGLLLAAAGDSRANDPHAVARMAHAAEVLEFASPGGMMDHFSTALGGAIWLDCRPPYHVDRLPAELGDFVLVDSGIPKDTNGLLDATRQKIESLPHRLGVTDTAVMEPPAEQMAALAPDQQKLFKATWRNRALTTLAKERMMGHASHEELGFLLTRHHKELSERLGTSHEAIDEYLRIGVEAGALGGKINGSGGGGSFFLYAPHNATAIREVFHLLGLRAWVVRVGPGLNVVISKNPESDQ